MSQRRVFTTPAILLRKVTCGESDVVATFFSFEMGKIPCFAKNAKCSMKRFGGGLELFGLVDITVESQIHRELYLLKEAAVRSSYDGIRKSIIKTAHAGYWCDLVNRWAEPEHSSSRMFECLTAALTYLDHPDTQPEEAGILFQIHYLARIGLSPELDRCGGCGTEIACVASNQLGFDLEKGRVLCHKCRTDFARVVSVSKGTVMQLKWMQSREFKVGRRMRFTGKAVSEGSELLEGFIPIHLGCMPKGLTFLRQIRSSGVYETASEPLDRTDCRTQEADECLI